MKTPKVVAGSDEVRTRIIGHCQKVFFCRGFNSVTMDEIADDLGISKKTLYQRFPSKKKIIETMLLEFIATARELMNSISSDKKLSLEEKMKAMIHIQLKRLNEIKPPFIHDLRRSARDVFDKVEVIRNEMLNEQFRLLFSEGVRQGKIRSGLNQELLMRFIVNGIRSTINPENMDDLRLTPAEAFEQIFTMIFGGITKKGISKL